MSESLSELGIAIREFLRVLNVFEQGPEQNRSYSVIEIAKVAIADAVLRERGLPTRPAPPVCRRPVAREPIPRALRWQVWEEDDFRCRRCGSRKFLEIDHIEPLALGGLTERANLQTLCNACNLRKGATRPTGGDGC